MGGTRETRHVDSLDDLVASVAADTGFSGVVRVDDGDGVRYVRPFGERNRAVGLANEVGTRFGIASGTKTFTALTVLSLVERGELAVDQPVRPVLGADLPAIDDRVTVGHLLTHRSGIGDYLDESAFDDANDHVMSVPVHRLAAVEDYLSVLDGFPQVSDPGDHFAYNNGGYVVLALVAERVTGVPLGALFDRYVCGPAGMTRTGFLRSDSLPGDVAVGYLGPDGLRSNVLHLPLVGAGDGGLFSTVDDIHLLWQAVLGGRIVGGDTYRLMTTPHGTTASGRSHYGMGYWLDPASDIVQMEGQDAGVSFRSCHRPSTRATWTVVSNTTLGAWPMCERLDVLLRGTDGG